MKKITATAIASFIGLSLLMTGCSKTTSTEDDIKTSEQNYKRVFMSASWSYGYGSIEEMTKASDIVAIVKIKDAENVLDSGIHFTDYTADVRQLIRGNDEKEIKIHMTGGIDDAEKRIYELNDDPLMQTGDEFLIFARKNQGGTYTILTGSQGRYVVKDNCVYPLTDSTVTVKSLKQRSEITADGETTEEFIKFIQSID